MERERVTVQQAASRLGLTESAVRKRVKRGLLEHDKEEDGRVFVYLDTEAESADTVRDNIRDSSHTLIIARLENEVEFLRAELERKDHLLARALERIPPAIEPPSEARESPVTVSEASGKGEARPEERRPPWWRRMFGG